MLQNRRYVLVVDGLVERLQYQELRIWRGEALKLLLVARAVDERNLHGTAWISRICRGAASLPGWRGLGATVAGVSIMVSRGLQ